MINSQYSIADRFGFKFWLLSFLIGLLGKLSNFLNLHVRKLDLIILLTSLRGLEYSMR